MTLSNLIEATRRAFGEDTASRSQIDDTDLTQYMNAYLQNLTNRAMTVAASAGVPIPGGNLPRFDMWKTVVTSSTSTATGLQIAASSSVAYLPPEYDRTISWWDNTAHRKLEVVRDTAKFHSDLRTAKPGLPRAVEILDFTTVSSVWRRQATLYPATPTGMTPSIELTYYRLPAVLDNTTPTTSYPDIDPKHQWVIVNGVVAELMKPSDPAYEKFSAAEQAGIVALLKGGAGQ